MSGREGRRQKVAYLAGRRIRCKCPADKMSVSNKKGAGGKAHPVLVGYLDWFIENLEQLQGSARFAIARRCMPAGVWKKARRMTSI